MFLRLVSERGICQSQAVKKTISLLGCCTLALLLFAGCLATPVSKSGGIGSVTVSNTNVNAIISAANNVFPQYGYTMGPINYPDSVSFDKPAGAFGKILYGSYGVTTTMRVTMTMVDLPGSNDYQLRTRVSRVSDAGEAGFEDSNKMMGLWSGEFKPLLEKISAQASGAGPM
jgi:hypothetical protein